MKRLSWLGLGGRGNGQNGSRDNSTRKTGDAGTADEIVQNILRIHSQLRKETDLRPCKTVNELLTKLVCVCTKVHDFSVTREVLSNPSLQEVLPSIRSICARAECCLESHWAEKIGSGNDADEVHHLLKSFPYYGNYEQLARLELCAICSLDPFPQKVAFIGSGPLPMTSLCILETMKNGLKGFESPPCSTSTDAHSASQVTVLNIDHDGAAIAVSQSLSKKLGQRGAGAEFLCTEAGSEAVDLRSFDVVYLAALVGSSQAEKEALVIKVVGTMRAGALIVIRSSWGLRTCLYSEFDVASEALLQRLDVSLVLHPYGEIVNSVIIARVKGHPGGQ
ncbi:nicotianamine synthase protein [Hirsutella rhossiliensis]|uniref:Nicotianamine synthase protein n=1 Tax=Hirsutella rhossiliensis TaxID=111463 RepID=A0A9P8MS82_9HYPO|nr:nicotianamine synthase protein [Hirsutella rhossiliensis]KAH0960998.1 nicotianamine synthase protein [Hirsutella rhossiliensis]